MPLSLRRRLIAGASRALDVAGLAVVSRRLTRRRPAVLMYHGLIDRPQELWRQILVGSEVFARHMEHLARYYRVLHFREIVDGIEAGEWPEGAVAVTFDDGLRSNYSLAFPHLRRLGIPATIFLTTGHIGTARPLWQDRLALALARTARKSLVAMNQTYDLSTPEERGRAFDRLSSGLLCRPAREKGRALATLIDRLEVDVDEVPEDHPYRPLTWEEVRKMKRSGLIEFGAHTRNHDSLIRQDPARASEQIRGSRDDIAAGTGHVPDLFAYPNGDESPVVRELVREAGFRAATVAHPGRLGADVDEYLIPRYGIGANHDPARFRLEVAGVLDRWIIGRSPRGAA